MNKSMEKWNGTRGIAESGVLKPLSETAYRRYRSFNNKPVDLIALIVARTIPSTIFRNLRRYVWKKNKNRQSGRKEWKRASISTTILRGIEIKLILEDWYFSSTCVDTSSLSLFLFFVNFSIFLLTLCSLFSFSLSSFWFSPQKKRSKFQRR